MGILPKVHPTHLQETNSLKKIASILPSEKFILRQENGGDYGVDCILEIIENGSATNIRSHIQLKSKKNQAIDSNGYFKYSVPIKTINYLSNTLSSIFLIYSESEDVVYWEWNSVILKKIKQNTKQGTKSFQYSFYKIFDHKNIDEIYLTIKNKNEIIIKSGLNSLEKGILENLITEDINHDLLLSFFEKNDYNSIIGKLKNIQNPTLGEVSLLSLSFYNLYQYDKALQIILKFENKGLKNNHLLKIKACIFCEKGIKEQNRNLVKDAKNIHEEALQNNDWDWLDYYNYANMDLALGNFEDAINNYDNALKINPKDEKSWKNLASCYYKLGKNKKALSFLEKALTINPELIEAILTKAEIIRDINKLPLDAVQLYDQALKIANHIDFNTSSILYYKSLSLYQGDRVLDAISTIQNALIYFPGDFYLTDLKLSILTHKWATDVALTDIAIQDFTQQISEHPNDIEAKKVLAEIFLKQKNYAKFEELIQLCLKQYRLPYHLEDLIDHDIESIFSFIKYIDQIHKYREHSNLCSELFSTYELNITSANKIQFHLDILFANLYINIKKKFNKKNLLKVLDNHILAGIKTLKVISNIISEYQALKVVDKEEIATNITNLLTYLPEIILGEISRQIGYTTSIFEYSPSILDQHIDTSKKLNNWFNLSIEPIINGANETYKVFKE